MKNTEGVSGSYCGADCGNCAFNQSCKGCGTTCGRPFGGDCIAAGYIKTGGKDAYLAFKQVLLDEINATLDALGYPPAEKLYELCGSYVNLGYTLPNGMTVGFLKDGNVYLGTQIQLPDTGTCIGVVADTTFILICSYRENGESPELLLFKKR